MTIVAFRDRDHTANWLKGMKELGYVVEGKKTAPSGSVLVLEKPPTPPVVEAAS